jgi:hypothetical protein
MSNRYLPTAKGRLIATNEPRMEKSEIQAISRALKAQVDAAKTAIKAEAPKLKADFELQLITEYPACGDPVWRDALNEALKAYEIQRARVEARCKELDIAERWWPQLCPPFWAASWRHVAGPNYEEYRAEMTKLHNLQVDQVIQSRLVQLEVDSANTILDLAIHQCITPAAKEFLARLPAIEKLIPKMTVAEVKALSEGRAVKTPPLQLNEPAKLLQLPPSDGNNS